MRVDHAQRGVAGGGVRHDEAHAAHVAYEIERFPFLVHFFEDRIDVLGASADLHLDVVFCQKLREMFLDDLDLRFAVRAFFLELIGDLLVFFRVEVAEAQVFEFPLDLPDAEAVGERGKDVERFLRDPLSFFLGHVTERAHVMQTVCKFDEHHAHVLSHGEKGLAQGFRDQVAFARFEIGNFLVRLIAVSVAGMIRVLVAA